MAESRTRRFNALAALLIFLAAAVALEHRALFGGEVLSAASQLVRAGPFPREMRESAPAVISSLSDSNCQFVPWLRFAADGLAMDGTLPLWKDTAGAGAPFIGNGQSAVFFPSNLLAIVAGAPPVVLALQVLAKLVAGAFGAWLLARHLGCSFLASLLCGFVFGFGGFQMGWFLHPHTNVSLLAPLLVLAADLLVLQPSAGRLALLAVVAGLQHFGGHPETALHAQLAATLLGGARLLSLRTTLGGRECARRFGWLLAGLTLGLTLAAMQVLPLLEYMLNSAALQYRQEDVTTRELRNPLAAIGFGIALVTALLALRRLATTGGAFRWPALLLAGATCAGLVLGVMAGLAPSYVQALAPEWFGASRRYMGPSALGEWSGAFAGATLPLVVVGLLHGRERSPVRAAAVALAIGLLAGYRAPLVSDVLLMFPVLNLAVNTRLQFVALLAAAVLAGFGLDALGPALRAGRERRRLACIVLALLIGAFGALICTVQWGIFRILNTPALPPGTSLIEARLLPARMVEPMFADTAPERTADSDLRICGYIALPAPTREVSIVYGRKGATVRAQWKMVPVPDAQPCLVFCAAIPASELLPERTQVRVRVIAEDGAASSTAMLVSPDDREPWLPFPARPASITGLEQPALLLLLLGLLLLALPRVPLGVLRLAVLLLVLLSLLSFASRMIPLLPRDLFYPSSPMLDALAETRPEGRMLSMDRHILTAEIPTHYGLADLRSYDALAPEHSWLMVESALGRTSRWAREVIGAVTDPDGGAEDDALAQAPDPADKGEPDLALLGLMSVQRLVYTGTPPAGLSRVPIADPGGMLQDTDLTVVENPYFLPRARLVGGAVLQPDDATAMERLRFPDFPRDRCIVLAEGHARSAPVAGIGDARIVLSRPDRVRVEIEPTAPGWLVLSDSWFPGWQAEVDGQPRDILRANVAFRAVAVRPGDRSVEFRYEPVWFRVGALLSAATALVLVLLSCLSGRPGTRSASRSSFSAS